ncbi:MAG: hypothetical protein PHF00_08140, partial [Elusimicrobia bacterium]|nr:hypothetical protein [Elusimicrobiota bacterium]
NYSVVVSTLLPIQYGVYLSTHDLAIPGVVDMNYELVITTSVIVTNIGNVTETFWLRATTTTADSPWHIGATQQVDRYALSAVMNATLPAAGEFGAEDKLDDPYVKATGTVFGLGQDGTSVPAGASRLLWFKLITPTATTTVEPQNIRITGTATAP